jgi:hypothetical protein
MKYAFFLAAIFLLFPQFSLAQSLNAGFVQGLWYSHEPIFDGETVRIYVALRNSTDDDMTATVEFHDNGERIGSRKISAISGRLIEAWTDWDATYGKHIISASLTKVAVDGVGQNESTATVTSPFAEDTIVVDRDTDGDGIGNEEDLDDDNDGISDEEEKENGTDPLVPEEIEEKINEPKENEEEEDAPVTEYQKNTPDRQGLERFFDDGKIENSLTSVTETIHNTKNTLDTYRESRNAETSKEKPEGEEQKLTQPTTTDMAEIATMTRSRLDVTDKSIFATVGGVLKAVFNGLYTFALYILSLFLGFPALVELALLLLILFAVYKTAKKLGQRPQ